MTFDKDTILKAITVSVGIEMEDLIEAAMVVIARCPDEPTEYRSYIASTGDEEDAAVLFSIAAYSIREEPGELIYDSKTEEKTGR